MKKDVVYIDAEDDITAIINKVKASTEKVVALVPPKRIGVLQSAVNLQLLSRTGSQTKKHVVIITNDKALSQLAASAKIPTARNLQSKPEIAEIPVLSVDDNDIIDGEKLSVGEYAEQKSPKDDKEDDLVRGIDVNDNRDQPTPTPKDKKKGVKVPNFSNFRKKLIIGIAALVVLVGGLIWALIFAPAATVILTAKTSPVSVNDVVKLGDSTDVERGVIRSVEQTLKKDVAIDFVATGEENKGDKATGVVRLSAPSTGDIGTTIEKGTELTSSSGKVYLTDSSVTMTLSNWRGEDVSVTAKEPGESYNGASGSLSGAPGNIEAHFTDATTGGTTKMVSVVTASDVQKAKQKLVDESTDKAEQELAAKFGDTIKIIKDSFNVDYGDVSSNPSVGDEAKDGQAKLESTVTYSMIGIPVQELEKYLRETMKQQMEDQTIQKVYSDGADQVTLSDYSDRSIRIDTTGQIGPAIDEHVIKERVAGKHYGDIREDLKNINGISDINVDFSYFWVRTVPDNLDRITIKFDIQGSSA